MLAKPLLIVIAMEIRAHIDSLERKVRAASKEVVNRKIEVVEGIESAC